MLRQLFSALLTAVPSKMNALHVMLSFYVTGIPLKYYYIKIFKLNMFLYNKTGVLSLQTFLRDKFAVWTNNGSCVEEME